MISLTYLGEQITNLQIPTPYTITDWFVVTNCAASPSSGTGFLTATLSQNVYTAAPVTYYYNLDDATLSALYVFENLLMTIMQPGEVILLVITN
jgi:hypothetical protein